MDNYISCNFMGGLGNQLFQAAHALSQGWKHNRSVVFVPKSSTSRQGRQTFNYVDNIFRNLTFINEISNFETQYEQNWFYSEIHPLEKNTSFYGYFQSSQNFLGFDDRIRKTFEPTEEFKKEFTVKYPELTYKNTLSLHVRRGDCIGVEDVHPLIDLKYYEIAINLIGEYDHIFIFSDDKSWVKDNIHLENSSFVDEEDYKELWIMSLCRNNIIANSTFSWWASFLNQNQNKKIIAPSIWFGPNGPQNYKDIYQKDWQVVNLKYENGWLV